MTRARWITLGLLLLAAPLGASAEYGLHPSGYIWAVVVALGLAMIWSQTERKG